MSRRTPRIAVARQLRKSPSRAPLRREGYSLLFSEASRVKLIRGLFGSTKADDHVRPRRNSLTRFHRPLCPKRTCRTHPICFLPVEKHSAYDS